MRSSIHIVDVDRIETWTRYRAGLCDSCVANCCTMPLEVRLPDLVRLGLVDPFEVEHEAPKQIARRLEKAGLIDHFNFKREVFTRGGPAATATSWSRRRAAAPCTSSGRTPAANTRRWDRVRTTALTVRSATSDPQAMTAESLPRLLADDLRALAAVRLPGRCAACAPLVGAGWDSVPATFDAAAQSSSR